LSAGSALAGVPLVPASGGVAGAVGASAASGVVAGAKVVDHSPLVPRTTGEGTLGH